MMLTSEIIERHTVCMGIAVRALQHNHTYIQKYTNRYMCVFVYGCMCACMVVKSVIIHCKTRKASKKE